MDGGANGHVFRSRSHFWKYVEIDTYIQQVSGTRAQVKGMGIVLISINKSGFILVLYPCYHMPDNPQDTLGLPALKYYGRMRSVRIETLSWLKIVTEKGDSIRTSTIPHYRKKELLDYIMVDIQSPTISSYTIPPVVKSITSPKISSTDLSSHIDSHQRMTHVKMPTVEELVSATEPKDDYPPTSGYSHALKTMIFSVFFPPIINHSFSKHEFTNWTILHRRFDHVHDDKLSVMCTKQLMDGLPSTFPVKDRTHKRDCWICPRGNLHHSPHGITLNTDHLRPGQLLHKDCYTQPRMMFHHQIM